MRVFLLSIALVFSSLGIAADVRGNFPAALLCIQRVLDADTLTHAPDEDARLALLREGVKLLRRIEEAGPVEDLAPWEGIERFMADPLLAIEIHSVIDALEEQYPDSSKTLARLREIQAAAQERIGNLVMQHYRVYRNVRQTIDNPDAIDALGDNAVSLLPKIGEPEMTVAKETKIGVTIEGMSMASGLPALGRAIYQLNRLLATCEAVRFLRLAEVARNALLRVYIVTLGFTNGSQAEHAIHMLRAWSGKSTANFLWEVEARRDGILPNTMWLMTAMRTQMPEDATNAQVLAEARLQEIQAGLFENKPVPDFIVPMLRGTLDWRPLREPDGTPIARLDRPIDNVNLTLLNALGLDERGFGDIPLQATHSAMQLVGDPRMDAASLLDWAQSLLGDRRDFSYEQYVRFLQEANAVWPIVRNLPSSRRAILSREHRKTQGEELGPSFDLWVADFELGFVVEAIEIKQTDRPRQASDLGGIIGQATKKLDGPLIRATPSATGTVMHYRMKGTANGNMCLRHLDARKILIIQIPWDGVLQYKRGSLTLRQNLDGSVEKWRSDKLDQPDGLLGRENIFTQITEHLPKVTDAHYFDEIRLTTVEGNPIVTFRNVSGKFQIAP